METGDGNIHAFVVCARILSLDELEFSDIIE